MSPEYVREICKSVTITRVISFVLSRKRETAEQCCPLSIEITGWKVHPANRAQLLERFPPAWPDVIADHATLDGNASVEAALPAVAPAQIVGQCSDGAGLQTLVVAIDGNSECPDGITFPITWSLDGPRNRKPVQSNHMIARLAYERLGQPVPIRLVPARLS